jgi:hypothetical protein
VAVPTLESLGFPVDTAACFTDHKGQPKKAVEKRQLTWLSKVAPALRRLLRPGETVLFTAPACSPFSTLEQLTTGWVIFYLKRCQLVITDQRILELPVGRDMRARGSACEIEHGAISDARVTSFLSRRLRLTYRDGRHDDFQQVDAKMAPKLKAVLPPLLARAMGTAATSGRQRLCPRCSARLREPDRCPHCFLEFKTREKATRHALLFPGGGYFYTGHPLLGAADALAEMVLLVLVLTSLAGVLSGSASPDDTVGLVMFGLMLVLEKVVSVYHARHYVKEFLPAEADFTPVKAA